MKVGRLISGRRIAGGEREAERVAALAARAVLEPICVRTVRCLDPALIDDPAKAIEAGVLVAGVAVPSTPCLM
jgi:hypothetical protein